MLKFYLHPMNPVQVEGVSLLGKTVLSQHGVGRYQRSQTSGVTEFKS